jgi:hypothetical protein
MDVLRMLPVPEGSPRPEPAPIQRLGLEQSWSEAEGMGGLAAVFEQDMANLPRVQLGLKMTARRAPRVVRFGLYQEARMRLIHRHIDDAIVAGLALDSRSVDEVAPFLLSEG